MKEVLIGNIEQRYEETNGLEVYIKAGRSFTDERRLKGE